MNERSSTQKRISGAARCKPMSLSAPLNWRLVPNIYIFIFELIVFWVDWPLRRGKGYGGRRGKERGVLMEGVMLAFTFLLTLSTPLCSAKATQDISRGSVVRGEGESRSSTVVALPSYRSLASLIPLSLQTWDHIYKT